MSRVMIAPFLAACCALCSWVAGAQDGTPQPTPSAPGDAPPIASGPTGQQTATDWPQTLTAKGRTFQVYEPLFNTMAGDQVGLQVGIRRGASAGAAASAAGGASTGAAQGASGGDIGTRADDFGIASILAQAVPADLPGELEINGFQVQSLTFGTVAATQEEIDALQLALGAKAISITRTALMQDMQLDNARAAGDPDLGSFVPAIRVEQVPAVLISVDSDPVLRDLGSTGWRLVQNTPFIFLQAQDGSFNVRLGASTWLSSMDIKGDYRPTTAPPPEVISALGEVPTLPRAVRMAAQHATVAAAAVPAAAPAAAPAATTPATPIKVIIATEPTVLLSLRGAPVLRTVVPGLETVENTESVLLHTPEGSQWWTLASGRWFQAPALEGPWAFVDPTQVPALFIRLPGDAKHAAAKASVPGTPEAVAAVAAAQEVRTVTLARAAAQCTVTYNGAPMWAAIDGTALQYGVNASQPVIVVDGAYYCCDNAVWFVASAPEGPWTLCDAPPDAIYQIGAYAPVSAATFVEVVASNTDSVTFGYSAGYLGTFVTEGTVVYGNGYEQQGTTLPNGAFQPMPQTYATPAVFDAQTGTFGPPAVGEVAPLQPAVQPQVLTDGYIGWGWCPGWTTAWAFGWSNPTWWDHWGSWWNNWNPYWNHWWDQHHIWQREQQAQVDQRLAQRQEAREDAAAAQRQQEISQQESQWRARQAEQARAQRDQQAQARAEEARFRDQRSYEQAQQERAARAQYAAQHSGPTAQPGSMLWWYEYYNDYSHGYLSRAGVFHDPRYGASGPPH